MDDKTETLLILGAVGLGGYVIYKSGILQNIGQVGDAVGGAASGAGSFIRETFVQGGETLREIGGTTQTVVREVGNIAQTTGEAINTTVGNVGGIVSDTTGTLRKFTSNIGDEIIQQEQRVLSFDDKLIQAAKGVFSYASNVVADVTGALRGGGAAITGAAVNLVTGGKSQVTSSPVSLKTDPASQGSITLPTSSNNQIYFTPSGAVTGTPIRNSLGLVVGVDTGSQSVAISSPKTSTTTQPQSLLSRFTSKLRSWF